MNFRLKKLFAIILTLIIVSISGTVFAVDVTVGNLALSTDKTVEQGKEFTVKINLSNFQTSASTVTIIGKIEYDKDKLEYVSGSIVSNTAEGWDDVESLGEQCFKESNMGFLFENRSPKKIGANSNFLTLKFKAKSNVEGNANITVSISSVSDATNFRGDSTTIVVAKPTTVEPPKTDDQDKNQGSGSQSGSESKPEGEGQQGQTQAPTQTQTPTPTQNEKDKNKEPSKSSGTDNTVKQGTLPKTGESYVLWEGFAVCIFVAAIMLFLHEREKYNEKKIIK